MTINTMRRFEELEYREFKRWFDKNDSFTYSTIKITKPDYIKPLVHTITMINDLESFFSDTDKIKVAIEKVSINRLASNWFIKILTDNYKEVSSFTGLTDQAEQISATDNYSYTKGLSNNSFGGLNNYLI